MSPDNVEIVRAAYAAFNRGSLRLEPRELIARGEQVVVAVEARGTGPGSGAEVQQAWAQLGTIRDGLIVGVEPFADRDAALEAAG